MQALWKDTNFLRFWAAQAFSLSGTQITALAIPLTAIVVLHVSLPTLGLIAAMQYIPFLLFGLPAGVWIDRLPRRPVLILTDAGRVCALASIPIGYQTHVLTAALLIGVAFVYGTLTLLFDVAHQSYLPEIVQTHQLVEANTKLQTSYSAAQLLGPSLGGVLIQVLSAPIAIVIDCLSYVASAGLIASTQARDTHERGGHVGWMTDMKEGLRFVLGSSTLRPIVMSTGFGNFFGFFGMVQAVFIVFAVRDLHLKPAEIGVAVAAGNLGSLVAAAANKRVARVFGVGVLLIVTSTAQGVGALLIALARPPFSVFELAAALAVAWFGIAIYNVNQISLRQVITPSRLLGRMNATVRVVIWGPIPLGALTGGFLATRIGLRSALLVAGVGGLAAALPLWLSSVRSLRKMPTGTTATSASDGLGRANA